MVCQMLSCSYLALVNIREQASVKLCCVPQGFVGHSLVFDAFLLL